MPCCEGRSCCDEPSRYPTAEEATAETSPPVWATCPRGVAQVAVGEGSSTSPYTYEGDRLAAVKFPVGGIGAGQVHLAGDGSLAQWNVNNAVNMTGDLPGTFFAAAAGGQAYALQSTQTYTAERRYASPNDHTRVPPCNVERMKSIPGIAALSLTGRYPIAEVAYTITGFPVNVYLEAYSPLLPGNSKDSGLPVAIFTFTASNPGDTAVDLQLMQSQLNFIGWDGEADASKAGPQTFYGGNTMVAGGAGPLFGMALGSQGVAPSDPRYGTMYLGAMGGKVTMGTAPSEDELWSLFTSGKFEAQCSAPPSPAKSTWYGGVAVEITVPPKGSASATFMLGWHFPNRMQTLPAWDKLLPPKLGAMYNNWFKNASDAAGYCAENFARLQGTTRLYRDTMFRSTIPWQLLDSAAGRVAVLRSPTVMWTEAGVLLGYEGLNPRNGCCPMNCSHVYGYTAMLERLFPDLARNMAESSFITTYVKGEGVIMRYGTDGFAIDGALASVIKVYLTVQQSDSKLEWLPKVWPNVKDQMEVMFTTFDNKGEGVIRNGQRNTYDSTMYGANTFIGSYYVAALRCAAIMAGWMNDTAAQTKYSQRADLAKSMYEKICWKEEFGYYVADVDKHDAEYSYGPGCFTDQVCAQALAAMAGLGYLFDPDHEKSARRAIRKYNFVTKPPYNTGYLKAGESGLCLCTYPNGMLDKMKYSELVGSGFEYQAIAAMVFDGDVDDATFLANAIRKRQDGTRRSPWNEPECGTWGYYSRGMAAWGVFDICCGFAYDSTRHALGFAPRTADPTTGYFRCFVTVEGGWGEYTQYSPTFSNGVTLEALEGTIVVSSLSIPTKAVKASATLSGKPVGVTVADGVLSFSPAPLTIAKGATLSVTLITELVVLPIPDPPAKQVGGEKLPPPSRLAVNNLTQSPFFIFVLGVVLGYLIKALFTA